MGNNKGISFFSFALIFVLLTGLVITSNIFFLNHEFKIIKEPAYVPTPINPNMHAEYIKNNYFEIVNEDNSISYVRRCN